MIRLYIKLFSISYDSLLSYFDDIFQPELWNKKRKIQNKKVNTMVFEFISKNKHGDLSDQFILDMINFFLYSSFKLRKNKLIKNKFYTIPKFMFISIALLNNLIYSIKILLHRIYHLLFTEIKIPEIRNKKKVALLVGFPEFSFSKNDLQMNYNSSFLENLYHIGLVDDETELLSFNEYDLKKLNNLPLKKNISFSKRQNRFIIERTFSINLSFLKLKKIVFTFFKYLKKFRFLPFSFYAYYITRILIANELKYIFSSLENRAIYFKTFFISTYDIGNIKYESLSKYYQYNYSRNNIYPSAQKTILNEINQSFNLTIDEILEDVELDNFTLSFKNSLGFANHSIFYSKLRNEINKSYKINLDNKIDFPIIKESYSNLGYAFIENINLRKEKINIIVFDIPFESPQNNISRKGIHGMYSVLRNFIEVYLKEIISTFNNDKFEIYYKGKYSDINKTLTLFEEIVKTERIAINVINEYSKINFGKGLKFDIAISQPFTSSYYNFKIISNESIYYIPNKYLDFIPKGIRGACYGVNDLRTKISNYEKNRR